MTECGNRGRGWGGEASGVVDTTQVHEPVPAAG